jgi:2'-5' RNA ligase
MRIFLAVFPPPETQALAASAIEKLRRPGDGVSWVKSDNLHYTLRFIGEVGEDGLGRVTQAAREAAAQHVAFGVAFGPPGAFPSARKARVIWLGLNQGNEPFAQLAASLEASLAKRGFEPEGRDFAAHLTLGRVRAPGHDWTSELIAAGAPEGPAARFGVEAIAVVESTLSRGGSIYVVRHQAKLREKP